MVNTLVHTAVLATGYSHPGQDLALIGTKYAGLLLSAHFPDMINQQQ